jgi:hypothetical protein
MGSRPVHPVRSGSWSFRLFQLPDRRHGCKRALPSSHISSFQDDPNDGLSVVCFYPPPCAEDPPRTLRISWYKTIAGIMVAIIDIQGTLGPILLGAMISLSSAYSFVLRTKALTLSLCSLAGLTTLQVSLDSNERAVVRAHYWAELLLL